MSEARTKALVFAAVAAVVLLGGGFPALLSQERGGDEFGSLFEDSTPTPAPKEEGTEKKKEEIGGLDIDSIDVESGAAEEPVSEEKGKKAGEERKKEAGEEKVTSEEISLEDIDLFESEDVKAKMFDEAFRAEAATYGFLLNYANTVLKVVEVPFGTPLPEVYPLLVTGFKEKGYLDMSSHREDDVVTRRVFAEFLFSILKEREGLQESEYPDKVVWAVGRGFLSGGKAEELIELPGLEVEPSEVKEIPLVPGEKKRPAEAVEEGEKESLEIPPLIDPNRVAGTVDVESNVTLKFVSPVEGVGTYKVMKKESAGDEYVEAGEVSSADMTFVDRKSLASFKVGREIVQYQISRSDEDFIVTVTYRESSGITVDKKVFYRIVPVKESFKPGKRATAVETPLLPEFLSGKVDFTGNVFLRWVEEEEGKEGVTYSVYWRKGYTEDYTLLRKGITGTEFADTLKRSEEDVAAVQEYQISRSLDNFIVNITYTDSAGMKHTAKYFYKVVRAAPGVPEEKKPAGRRDYVTRGEVMDAFSQLEPPRWRRRLEIPVFSPVHTLPASPI